jgi:copper chaperone CopZ
VEAGGSGIEGGRVKGGGTIGAVTGLLTVHAGRLRTMPALRVLARERASTRVAVDGLVCGVCAARTHSALARVAGVYAVRVDLGQGTAEVQHAAGAPPDDEALQRALASVVVAGGLRRWLARGVAWREWRAWGVR